MTPSGSAVCATDHNEIRSLGINANLATTDGLTSFGASCVGNCSNVRFLNTTVQVTLIDTSGPAWAVGIGTLPSAPGISEVRNSTVLVTSNSNSSSVAGSTTTKVISSEISAYHLRTGMTNVTCVYSFGTNGAGLNPSTCF